MSTSRFRLHIHTGECSTLPISFRYCGKRDRWNSRAVPPIAETGRFPHNWCRHPASLNKFPICRVCAGIMDEVQYSIVIPAYNEQARIGATLDRVMACVEERRWAAEVLVVNDGSRDKTASIVLEAAHKYPNL